MVGCCVGSLRTGAEVGISGHQLDTVYVPCDCHQERHKEEEERGYVRMIWRFWPDKLLKMGLGRAMSRRVCLNLRKVWASSSICVPIEVDTWRRWLTMSTEVKEAGITVLNEVGLVKRNLPCLNCALTTFEGQTLKNRVSHHWFLPWSAMLTM